MQPATTLLNMGKKNDKAAKAAKRQRGLEKSLKNQKKSDSKSKKLDAKIGADDEDDMDLDQVLAEMSQKQEEFERVDIKVTGRPSKRQNGTMIANPTNRRELLLFGGENLTKEGSVQFYNDLYVYNTHTDTWRIVKSANAPLPRSSHAMCAHPSGVIVMHGGEFSSPKQSTFHHYGDTWILDGETKEWTKIETKNNTIVPQSRSGHRMCVWKNYVLLHGGFRDLSQSTSYLGDLWAFDISDYKWHKIEIPPTLAVPDPRSGHSLLPTTEGAALYGGYTKVKAGKGQQKGKVLQDSWMLHMKTDLKNIKWERRKKGAFAPSPRTGCQLVPHRVGTGRGVMFGGVYDTEETEESLNSTFFNTFYSYNAEANRWYYLRVRNHKQQNQAQQVKQSASDTTGEDLERNLSEILKKLEINMDEMKADEKEDDGAVKETDAEEEEASTKEYPFINSPPHPRFNSTMCVSGDTLYVYGGTWEDGDREYQFDSFYALDLGKLDGIKVFWEELGLDELEQEDVDEEEDDDEDAGEDGESGNQILVEDEEEVEDEVEDEDESSKDPRPWLPHPKAFETMGQFYAKHMNTFVEWALRQEPDARGKDLRTHAFELARSRWWERRENVQALEDQLEELGGVNDVVERTSARTRR